MFWERFYSLCEEKGTKPNPVAEDLNISSGLVTKWKQNKTLPNGENLIKLADYFDCSIDYLLDRDMTVSLESIKTEFSKLFSQDNTFTIYAFSLWEAQNELYHSSLLFADILHSKPFKRNNDWVNQFKYNILVICEISKIIFLDDKNNKKIFSAARSIFLKNKDIQTLYDKFKAEWNTNKSFFINARNNIVHFDHEKSDFYHNTIEDNRQRELYSFQDILCDFDNPLFLDVLRKIYSETVEHCDLSNKEDIDDKIVKLLTKFSILQKELLSSMVTTFFSNYAQVKNDTLGPTDTTPFFSYKDILKELRADKEKKFFENFNALTEKDKNKVIDYTNTLYELYKLKNKDKKLPLIADTKKSIPATEEDDTTIL